MINGRGFLIGGYSLVMGWEGIYTVSFLNYWDKNGAKYLLNIIYEMHTIDNKKNDSKGDYDWNVL